MPRPLYVDFQRSFRPVVAYPAINDEWKAKTKAQQDAWKAAYVELRQVDADVQGQTPIADASHARAVAQAANGPLQPPNATVFFRNFFRDVETAIRDERHLRALIVDVIPAWTNLRAVELAQPNQVAQSVAHLAAGLNAARNNLANIRPPRLTQLLGFQENPPVPANAVGDQRIPASWIEDRWDVRRELFDQGLRQDMANDNIAMPDLVAGPQAGHWIAQREFSGGLSKGWLWLQVNDDGFIIDRVFRKDVFHSERSWTNARMWDGDVRNIVNSRPWELACHFALTPIPNLENIVRVRRGRRSGLIDHDNHFYRYYLEWAAHRDLAHLLDNHINENTPVPEAMVWYVAEALAKCGLAMEQGSLEGPVAGWDQIVHRDLKPLNIFLDSANPNLYPDYPKPVLGDFGLAFRTRNNDIPHRRNPRWYNASEGTPGFLSPEQRRWYDAATWARVDEWPLLAHTNVFGVGLILRCLVTNTQSPPIPLWLHDGNLDQTLRIQPGLAWAMNNYSLELLALINSCLRFDPATRPSFQLVRDYVAAETAEGPGGPDRAMGMRTGNANAATALAQRTRVPVDQYRIGFAQNIVP